MVRMEEDELLSPSSSSESVTESPSLAGKVEECLSLATEWSNLHFLMQMAAAVTVSRGPYSLALRRSLQRHPSGGRRASSMVSV